MNRGPTEGPSGIGVPSLADVRVRLEGQLEPVERAREIYPRLLAKLTQPDKERELPVDVTELSEAMHLERALEPALAQLRQRAEAESWPAKSWPVKLSEDVEDLRAQLARRLRQGTGQKPLAQLLSEAQERASSEPLLRLNHKLAPRLRHMVSVIPGLAMLAFCARAMTNPPWWFLLTMALVVVGQPLLVLWAMSRGALSGSEWLGVDLPGRALVLWKGTPKPRRAVRVPVLPSDAIELQRHEHKRALSYRLRLVRAGSGDVLLCAYAPRLRQVGAKLGRELAAKLSIPFREET